MTWRTGYVAFMAVGLIALSSAPAGAQGTNGNAFQNWNFLGGGARARGMGGAYLGISDDVYAATWNPAGLIYNEGVLLGVNYAYSRIGMDLDYGAANHGTISDDRDSEISNLSAASFVSPLTIMERELIASVYYNRVQDVYNEAFFEADRDPIAGAPFSASYGLSGNVAVAGGGIGTTIYRRLSIGASLALLTGDGAEHVRTDIDSTRDTTSFNQHTIWESRSDLDYSGLTATFGALYRADRWSAGIVFSPAYGLTQAVDYYARRTSIRNQIPDHSRPIYGPLHGSKREITIPYTVGLGGSYKLNDKVLLAADYQYRAFNADDKYEATSSSNYRIQESPSEPNSDFEEIPVAWFNLHQVRLGAEYIHETSWGVVPLRLGLRNDPLLLGDPTGNDIYFDQRLEDGKTVEFPYYSLLNESRGSGSQINGWTVTVGSGIHWSQIRLDAAFELTSFSYQESGDLYSVQRCPNCLDTDDNVTNDKWDKRQTHNWGAYIRNFDNSKVRFMVNFTGYF